MPSSPAAPANEIYRTPGARKRAVGAWCLYDFASSSYTTLIITVAFAVYFREAIVNAPDNTGDQYWGLANFFAMLIVALVSPVIGAIADESGSKKLFLILTTLQTVAATALLAWVSPGQIVWAMALYVVATVGFESGYVFYNSFLFELSTPATIGRISGWAWGVGFIGGLTALLLCAPLISSELKDPAGMLVDSAVRDRKASFLVVAAFFLVFALPAFVWLQGGARRASDRPWSGHVITGFRRVGRTLGHLRQHREVAKYILASLFFNDGITTVSIFAANFATVTFGLSSRELTLLFIVLNVVAIPGAVLAGYLADAIGAKRTLILTLVGWMGVVLIGYLAASRPAFWVMACAAAIGMGSTQAVARSFMAEISPAEREAEFFGFYVLSGKFAAIFGPLIFGLISAWTGSQRLAVLSLLPLFVAGLVLMASVDPQRARGASRAGSDHGLSH